MIDYYKILKIPYGASESEVKKQFRILAKVYHPDKNGGSEGSTEVFKLMVEAYNVLSDHSARSKYDQRLKNFLSRSNERSFSNSKNGSQFGKNTNTEGQNQKKSESAKDFYTPLKYFLWIISCIIVVILAYSIFFKETEAEFEKVKQDLEKDKVDNRPESGEIDFNEVK